MRLHIIALVLLIAVSANASTNFFFAVDRGTAVFMGDIRVDTDNPVEMRGQLTEAEQAERGIVWIEVTSEQYAAGFEAYGAAAAEAARAAAVADIESRWTEIERKAHVMQFLMDNRIRVLESRGTNTWAQYKSEVDAL